MAVGKEGMQPKPRGKLTRPTAHCCHANVAGHLRTTSGA